MTEQFFDKELAARKIEAIPGLMEFDIPVDIAKKRSGRFCRR